MKKTQFTWLPENCETFYEVYDSIEECIAEAQKQFDERYEYYEYEDDEDFDESDKNSTIITVSKVVDYDMDKFIDSIPDMIVDRLEDKHYDFTGVTDIESEVYVDKFDEYKKEVIDALTPIIKKRLSVYPSQVGQALNFTYNVKTRKYIYEEQEYDELPEPFRNI